MESIQLKIWENFYIVLPHDIFNQLFFSILIIVVLLIVIDQFVSLYKKRRKNFLAIVFIAISIFFSYLLVIARAYPFRVNWFFSISNSLDSKSIIIFSFLPMVFTAIFLGREYGIIAGFIGGLIRALSITHHSSTIIEETIFALLISYLCNDRKIRNTYPLLKNILASLSIAVVISIPIFQIIRFISEPKPFPLRLDQAFYYLWIPLSSRIIEVYVAGFIIQIVLIFKKRIIDKEEQEIRPHIKSKVLLINILFFFLLSNFSPIIILWNIERYEQRKNIEKQLNSRAGQIEKTLSSILGKNILLLENFGQLIFDDLEKKTSIDQIIKSTFSPLPHFNQIIIFDSEGSFLSGYPVNDERNVSYADDEIRIINEGISSNLQNEAIFTNEYSDVTLSIIYPISRSNKDSYNIFARTNLSNNPINQAFSTLLELIQYEEESLTIVNNTGKDLMSFNMHTSTDQDVTVFTVWEENGWGIYLSFPFEELIDNVYHECIPLFIILIVLNLVFLISIFIFIWKPLNNLESLLLNNQDGNLFLDGKENFHTKFNIFDGISNVFFSIQEKNLDNIQLRDSLNEIWKDLLSFDNFNDLFTKLLTLINHEDILSTRLIIQENQKLGLDKKTLIQGIDNEIYAVYDATVTEFLGQKLNLYIDKASRLYQFNLLNDQPNPGAIAAFSFLKINAVFWIAYKHEGVFNLQKKNELDFYFSQMCLLIDEFLKIFTIKNREYYLHSVVENYPVPIFLFIDNEMVFLNKNAREYLNSDSNSENASITNRIRENEIRKLADINPYSQMTIIEKEIDIATGEKLKVHIFSDQEDKFGQIRWIMLEDISRDKKRIENMNRYIQTLSHNFRSPLSIIRGYTTMLQMVGDSNKQQKEYIERIVGSVDRLSKFAENMLDEERILSIDEIKLDCVDIVNIIDDALLDLELFIDQKKLKIEFKKDKNLSSRIFIDQILFKEALINILENAVKYSDLNSKVEINIIDNRDTFEISIIDSASGISPLDLPYIFEKFYIPQNIDQSNSRNSGFGLYLAKNIIEKLGGQVKAESVLGRGTTIKIILNKKNDGEI